MLHLMERTAQINVIAALEFPVEVLSRYHDLLQPLSWHLKMKQVDGQTLGRGKPSEMI